MYNLYDKIKMKNGQIATIIEIFDDKKGILIELEDKSKDDDIIFSSITEIESLI